MQPVNAKTFYKEVADETGLPEKLIEDVVSYYWEDVRKSLSSLSCPRVHITNLGDFVIKHWNLDGKIEKLEQFEERNKLKGLQQITARFKIAETLFQFKDIKKAIEEENQRKDFIKRHKTKQYELEKKHNTNMEK